MEKNEVMNAEVMDNAYDVIPVADCKAKKALVTGGIVMAVAAGCYGAYIGTKKLIRIIKAKKDAMNDVVVVAEAETKED